MEQLTRGQKSKIDTRLLELTFDSFYDVSCFCLDENDKLIDDNHMIFYNQLATPDNQVTLKQDSSAQKFSLNLPQLSSKIKKMSFVITSDNKEIKSLAQAITCKSNDFNFTLNASEFQNEKAIMFCEVYIKDGQWRFNAFAQGFNDGLSAVLKHFGGTEETSTPPVAKPVSLTKISLTKYSKPAKVSLAKDCQDNSYIEVSAKWYDNGDGEDDNDDLDLRIGILLPDGRMTMVHSAELGNLTAKPFVGHSGDVQVVQNSEGMEKVQVNPKISHLLKGRVALVFSVYSAVGNGQVSVASLKPIMEIKTKEGLISCEFNTSISSNPSVYTYVIGIIIIDGDTLTVKHLGSTSKPGSEATPWLEWTKEDLPKMDIIGPQNFKGEKLSKNTASISGGGVFSKGTTIRYIEHSDI
jgi:tellurite resistance protein TerA